jgi:hypothetical protein
MAVFPKLNLIYATLFLFFSLLDSPMAARIPLAVFGEQAFFYENVIHDMLTHDIETALYFQPRDHGEPPKNISFHQGYLLDESQTLHLESGKHIMAVLFRSPAKARYAKLEVYLVSQNDPYLTLLPIPDIEQPVYAGKIQLGTSEHTHFLKVYSAVVSPFYGPPYAFEINSFGLWDSKLSLVSRTYSKPEDYPGLFNLARRFLELKEYQKSITFTLLGLELLKNDPDLLDDGLRSQVRIHLAKAYLGFKDYQRAGLILTSIVEDLPNTAEAPEAAKLLKSLTKK